ncbi:MAG: protein kinase [Acidobacteriota bacterium]
MMTPERWQQINELYHHALELDADQQAIFLNQACAGDAELRDDVESLIASHNHAGSFLVEPALKVAARVLGEARATLLVGRKLSHYRIESLIGVGGMGEVYLAEDTRLDRKVAVKILNTQFSQHESNLDRFIQEAKAASALNHPNILVIHEIGVSDEAHYIVSEFIEGKTLREMISESPLQLPEVLDISVQVANALCTAHEAHLIHRDIKPENIMIRPDGYLKILDFGLAKIIEQNPQSLPGLEGDTAKPNQTAKGVIMGTVNYMSPEQAKGEPVDQRTDIFSLGVMMHEMLAGRTPFAGATISETFANLINAEPQPLSSFTVDQPVEVQRIIFKLLRKNPDERFHTMKEVLTDLKHMREAVKSGEPSVRSGSPGDQARVLEAARAKGDTNKQSSDSQLAFSGSIPRHKALTVIGLLTLLVGAIGLGSYFLPAKTTASSIVEKTSIAVLPLRPINTSNRDQLYELGIADALILRLSSMQGLSVRSLSATRKYADIEQDPIAAGREQEVDYVLASNYQLAGGKIRITSQLFNVANGQIEETYKGEKGTADIFAMQDAIAGEVENNLSARFATTSSGREARRGTTNEEAYRLYLQGMYLIGKRSPADAQEAVAVLEQAVRLDPNYARAWAGKANAHLADFSGNPHTQYQRSMEAVNKALALDDNLAEAHSVLCSNKMSYEWDFDTARRECERAVALDANSSLAHLYYSRYLNGQGRSDAAIAEVKSAIDLEPTSLASQRQYGMCLYYARRYPEAVTQFKRVVAMDKGFGAPYNWLISTLEMQGNYSEAFEWLMKMKALYKEPEEEIQAYRTAYQTSGWPGLLRERARRRDAMSFRAARGSLYFQGAIEQAKVGNKDQAFKYLEQSYRAREYWMMFLKVEPGLDSLRPDPRFDELVRRVGLG